MFFFFFKQKTAYEIMPSLVGSEMCIRDSSRRASRSSRVGGMSASAPGRTDTVSLLERREPAAYELLTCRLALAEDIPDLPRGQTGRETKDDRIALIGWKRRHAPAQLRRGLIRDEPRLQPFVGIGRPFGPRRGQAATSVVDRGVASDTDEPRADARATGPVARDRDESPLEGERRQVGRVVPVGRPGPQVAVHRAPVPHVERLERRAVVPSGESEIVVPIKASRGIAGDVLELLHAGRPSRVGSSPCTTSEGAASGQGEPQRLEISHGAGLRTNTMTTSCARLGRGRYFLSLIHISE